MTEGRAVWGENLSSRSEKDFVKGCRLAVIEQASVYVSDGECTLGRETKKVEELLRTTGRGRSPTSHSDCGMAALRESHERVTADFTVFVRFDRVQGTFLLASRLAY